MTLGTADDVRWLLSRVSTSELREVLRDPPIGIFNPRSWNFWHIWLRLNAYPSTTRASSSPDFHAVTFKSPRAHAGMPFRPGSDSHRLIA